MIISNEEIHAASILIVDDQESNISLLQEVLFDAGYIHLSTCNKPREVCKLHQQYQYDLILLDLHMPEMDGFMVMEALKLNTTDVYLPVIVLTAQPNHKLRALQAGAKDFISKPFDLLEVKTRIHNMLEVRLLYKRLQRQNNQLEEMVRERTSQLLESEASYRSLVELVSDWYWEQDETGKFTKVSGPVLDMLGMQEGNRIEETSNAVNSGWNDHEREALRSKIANRLPFLDFIFSRVKTDGSLQRFQVSGEPRFDRSCRFIGYRGIGVELFAQQ